jgi:prohibitin 2
VYVGTNRVDEKVAGASNDLQTVNMDIALNYNIDPSRVISIYRDLGNDQASRVIQPSIQEVAKQVLAQYTAEQLITKREEVNGKIAAALATRLRPYGIVAQGTSVINLAFSRAFDEAIEAKITAQQNALRVENEVKQTTYEAQKKVVQSEADLQVANNTAKANDVIGKSLAENPSIVEKMKIEKWDGHYPQYMMGNGVPLVQLK